MSEKKQTSKDNIYIDAEDDITSVIERVKAAKTDIVALVIPKRSELLKSLVNMKLLNKAAVDTDKKLVLVTKDRNVEQVAANVGMYTAKTVSSKPSIPEKKTLPAAKEQPVKHANHESESKQNPAKDTIKKTKPSKKSKPKKFKVPNFEAFRLRLILALLVLLLLPVAWYVMYRVLPKATLTIETNARSISLQSNISAVLEAPEDAVETVVYTEVSSRDDLSEQVTATGEKQVGTQASGLVTISNCSDSPLTLDSGTGFSAANLTFISQVDVSLDSGNFTSDSICKSTGGHVKTITVVAQEPGDQYNLGSRNYTIAGSPSGITAFGADMTGGSSDVVAVIQQIDIDDAGNKIDIARRDQDAREELVQELTEQGLIPLEDTFIATPGELQIDVEVDQEVDKGTISQAISYTMSGIKETDVLAIVLPQLEAKAGTLKIIDSGLSSANYSSTETTNGYSVVVKLNALAGLLLTEDQVYQAVLGRPGDEAATDIRQLEGVKSVEVSTSPLWSTSIPSDQSKVTIVINGNN